MRLIDVRLRTWLRRTLYAVLALSACTGMTFYVLKRWFQIEGEFGPQSHPWQYPALQVHGGSAMLMTMLIGAMLLNHVPASWRTHRSRPHGLLLAGSLLTMLILAWCLYYLGQAGARDWVATVHWVVGLTLPLQLGGHVLLGRKSRQLARASLGRSVPVGVAR